MVVSEDRDPFQCGRSAMLLHVHHTTLGRRSSGYLKEGTLLSGSSLQGDTG